MKNFLFFLLLSGFAFGQNVELLRKLQNGDNATPGFLAEQLIPSYKLIKTKTFDNIYGDETYFTYLPKETSEKDIADYLENRTNGNAITISYVGSGNHYTLIDITGKCELIFDFWKKQIQPNIQVKNSVDVSQDFHFVDAENNIDYYFNYIKLMKGSSCHFNNMNSHK